MDSGGSLEGLTGLVPNRGIVRATAAKRFSLEVAQALGASTILAEDRCEGGSLVCCSRDNQGTMMLGAFFCQLDMAHGARLLGRLAD